MPKIAYQDHDFSPASLQLIEKANEIIADYQGQGFDLTLRQLYYQFVARDIIRNRQSEYKRLGSVVNDARLAGHIDWNAIVDRTRNLEALSHWNDPSEIVSAVAQQFRHDKWADQPERVEVWIEKDALAGVFERICQELDVPYLSCRGYTSQSEMWAAAQRLRAYERSGQHVNILHFGDHDPSGKDMSRDIEDRLRLFRVNDLNFQRIALNMDQVEQYSPPPNPAKITDSRSDAYISEFGDESWELDALDPAVLAQLVRDNVEKLRDEDKWQEAVEIEEIDREALTAVSDRWDEVKDFVERDPEPATPEPPVKKPPVKKGKKK